ncbi:tumor necrosis factor receptor superfamily member 5-like [Ptychodera flava]|uniref:tumor necrosis factor receptor superfamily member 5-like n=1 Tax=Ptychodera flava TaxID=63121 RepID=UPI00396A62DE
MADVSVSRGFLSHPLTIAVVLSLLCDVMTAPTETDTCRFEDHKYYFNDICCDMCAPGHKVESHCTSSNSTSSCVPCRDDYFQKDWSGDTRCTVIDKCDGRFENVSKRALDKTMNNECACNVGYKYSDSEDKRCIEAQDEKQTPLKVPKEHSTTELPKIPQHVVLPRVVIQEYSTAADIQTSTYSSTEITTSIALPCQPADNDLTDEIISNQNKFHIMLIITVIIIVICLAIVVAFVLVKVCCIKGYCSEKCRTKVFQIVSQICLSAE